MRGALVALVLLMAAAPMVAQERVPRGAVWGGIGVSFGGAGVLAEVFPGRAPLSLVGGVGYGPRAASRSYRERATFAAGARAYVGGASRPVFLELAYAALAADAVSDGPGAGDRVTALYGPALQLGAHFRLFRGLVGTVASGGGYATTPGVVASPWKLALSAGVGLAFGRRGTP